MAERVAEQVEEPPLLDVRGLKTHFHLDEGLVRAVDGVDLAVRPGETVCVVGESGCGKSITARSILQLVEEPGRIVEGEVLLRIDEDHQLFREQHKSRRDRDAIAAYRAAGTGQLDLARLDPKGSAIRQIRGKDVAMIFQEPMVSLSPVHTIGYQIVENIRTHEKVDKKDARDRAIEELRLVGIPRPEQRVDAYTFELSGGMRQRAMIAMALACRPRLLIADEPTTALDVTTQAQILELLQGLQEQLGMAVMFITHDLGVVAEIADRVTVMYLGIVAEECDVDDLFHDPRHPYTRALLRSVPTVGPRAHRRLATIRGIVPHPYNRPAGCPFHARCDSVMPGKCDVIVPPVVSGAERAVRCLLYDKPDDLLPAPTTRSA
ncbi:ABC transporter ATP-binding protein [Tenggerimyces flavus]|uniref:ABC transporter ATP-binding protein n=1 Tax=Tenggerimyces flavus TaxID=1708749 RepID=A0ABV7Y5E7_9ACTN|nr:ABC transporter ATP-binding protein [Tenggerimyces flavus]MBM7788507.1 peptide/nickel transport system ATP-binding protein [Tenggerimyces flavus]